MSPQQHFGRHPQRHQQHHQNREPFQAGRGIGPEWQRCQQAAARHIVHELPAPRPPGRSAGRPAAGRPQAVGRTRTRNASHQPPPCRSAESRQPIYGGEQQRQSKQAQTEQAQRLRVETPGSGDRFHRRQISWPADPCRTTGSKRSWPPAPARQRRSGSRGRTTAAGTAPHGRGPTNRPLQSRPFAAAEARHVKRAPPSVCQARSRSGENAPPSITSGPNQRNAQAPTPGSASAGRDCCQQVSISRPKPRPRNATAATSNPRPKGTPLADRFPGSDGTLQGYAIGLWFPSGNRGWLRLTCRWRFENGERGPSRAQPSASRRRPQWVED